METFPEIGSLLLTFLVCRVFLNWGQETGIIFKMWTSFSVLSQFFAIIYFRKYTKLGGTTKCKSLTAHQLNSSILAHKNTHAQNLQSISMNFRFCIKFLRKFSLANIFQNSLNVFKKEITKVLMWLHYSKKAGLAKLPF